MFGVIDINKKESWFLFEEKVNVFLKFKIKKEFRIRVVLKEEVKIKVRVSIK